MRIGIIEIVHNNPRNLIGGDEVVHRLLKNVFEKEGHSVDIVRVEYPKSKLYLYLRCYFGDSFFVSKYINKKKMQYDILICDSILGYGITHPKCICLCHFSYKGYRRSLMQYFKLKEHLMFIASSYMQKIGTKNKYTVSVSEYLKKILVRQGIRVNEIITNAVDTSIFYPKQSIEKKYKYLYAGGSSYYGKGYGVLNRLAEKGLCVHCVTNVDPGDKLFWIKNVNHEEMPTIYNQYRIVLYPSRFEALGMVPLEAMACGLPVVISNVGLGFELKREIPEFVVEGWGDAAVEEYIYKIKLIESNYEAYSRKAVEYVLKNHSMTTFAKKWINTIERIYSGDKINNFFKK